MSLSLYVFKCVNYADTLRQFILGLPHLGSHGITLYNLILENVYTHDCDLTNSGTE